MNNKPILFIDFYKTLNHDAYWRSLPVNEQNKIQNFLFENRIALVEDWMRGKYTAEQINQILSEHLNISYNNLWNTFVQDCRTVKIQQDILKSINKLREKYFVILLTDNMDNFTRYTQPALKLENYFDFISNSFDQRMLKKDNSGKLFLKYTRLYNTKVQDCISLDDSQTVCEVFTKLGGVAYLVTPEEDISFWLKKIA